LAKLGLDGKTDVSKSDKKLLNARSGKRRFQNGCWVLPRTVSAKEDIDLQPVLAQSDCTCFCELATGMHRGVDAPY